MAKPVAHLSRIRQIGDRTVTGTLCGRMSGAGDDINCTSDELDVTCKFCLPVIAAYERGFLIENGMPV
jgi:hypothetical protein